jgi:regulator of sigma D
MLDHGDKAFVAGIRQGAARVENLRESVCDNRSQARVSDGLSRGHMQTYADITDEGQVKFRKALRDCHLD